MTTSTDGASNHQDNIQWDKIKDCLSRVINHNGLSIKVCIANGVFSPSLSLILTTTTNITHVDMHGEIPIFAISCFQYLHTAYYTRIGDESYEKTKHFSSGENKERDGQVYRNDGTRFKNG